MAKKKSKKKSRALVGDAVLRQKAKCITQRIETVTWWLK